MKFSKKEWDETGKVINVKPLKDAIVGEETYEPVINHPIHYNKGKFETIDVIEDWDLDFHCGNAVKYISRHKYKRNPEQDIQKAIWYLNRYLSKLEKTK